jgi:hypothetical protein
MGRQLLFVAVAITMFIGPPPAGRPQTTTTAGAGRSEAAAQGSITREQFLATTWRLTGGMFSMLPRDGFPIAFRPDGTILARNLGGFTTWSLDDDELVLSGDRYSQVIRLKWLPERGVFRNCPVPARIPLFVFPEATADPLSIGCSDVPAAVLTLQIALDKAAYRPGEPIVATATLTNVGNAAIDVRRSAGETGGADGFLIELSKDSANALQGPPPQASGAPGVAESLPAGATHTRKLLLNRLLGTLKPGGYRLTIIYIATYRDTRTEIRSEPVTLEIIPAGAARSSR